MNTLHLQRPLIESYIRNNDARTAAYMRVMNEGFVIPFNKNVSALGKLMEATMTADQIQQVFGHAERIASAGGDNKTLLGKGAGAVGAAAGAVGQGAKDLAAKGAAGIKQLADKILAQNKANFEKSLPPADAGPVENFEQQATQAAEQIQDPKAKQSVMDLIKQGAKNPAVQTMVLAAVGGIATIVAGPAIAGLGLGMAATGALTGGVVGGLTGVVRGAMQGQGLKGALKQGAMGAGLGALGGGVAGAVAQGAQAYMQNKANAAADQSIDDKMAAGLPFAKVSVGAKTPEGDVVTGLNSGGHTGSQVELQRPDGSTYSISRQDFYDRTGQQGVLSEPTGPVSAGASSDPMAGVSDPSAAAGGGMKNPDGTAMTNAQVKAAADRIAPVAGGDADPNKYYNSLSPEQQRATDDAVVAQAQSAAATQPAQGSYTPTGNAYVDHLNKAAANGIHLRGIQKQSRVNTGTPVIEYIDRELTARMWILHESVGKARGNVHLTEAGIGDMFKKAGNWLKTKAGNLTNKVTADKLQQAWTKAGSPTDSGQVAAIMTQAGVPQESVDQIFKNMGLPAGSSTPAQAPAEPAAAAPAAPAQPKQGLIGKAAGAVGGAIGSVKGAIAGAKDSFAQSKEQGFDTSRANQAGDAVGATGEANPYAKSAPAAADGAPAATGTPQQTGGQTPTQGQAAPAGGQAPETPPAKGKPLTNVAGTINSVASGINAATDAIKAGQGMGTSMQSLAQISEPNKSSVKIKDAQGQDHEYKKVGQQWFDKDNKPVNAAQSAMLDKQAEQQAALGKPKAPAALAGPKGQIPGAKPPAATKQEPVKIGGQTLDPANPADKKIIDKVQAQQGGAAQQPGATDPRDLNKDGTVDATEKSIARNKAKTGGEASQATAPQAAAQAQSPEEIRKAKQATAAKTAQDQMAANPAPQKAAPNDVMARMAKQLAPAAPAGQQMPGYGKVTYNVPTASVPQQPAVQPTTGAKAVPVEKPAAAPAPAAQPTASAQADANKPGFLQSKIKGSQVPAAQPAAPAKPGFLQTATDKIAAKAAQPQMAGMDFSAMLARKAKIRL